MSLSHQVKGHFVRWTAPHRRGSDKEGGQARPDDRADIGEGPPPGRSARWVSTKSLTKGMAAVVGSLVCIAVGLVVVGSPGTAERADGGATTSLPPSGLPPATVPPAAALATGAAPALDTTGNASVMFDLQQPTTGLTPAAPGATAKPTPTAVASAPPLRSDEVFGFVPSWDLGAADDINLGGLTTIDYFSLNINPDGSIENSGTPGTAT